MSNDENMIRMCGSVWDYCDGNCKKCDKYAKLCISNTTDGYEQKTFDGTDFLMPVSELEARLEEFASAIQRAVNTPKEKEKTHEVQ